MKERGRRLAGSQNVTTQMHPVEQETYRVPHKHVRDLTQLVRSESLSSLLIQKFALVKGLVPVHLHP